MGSAAGVIICIHFGCCKEYNSGTGCDRRIEVRGQQPPCFTKGKCGGGCHATSCAQCVQPNALRATTVYIWGVMAPLLPEDFDAQLPSLKLSNERDRIVVGQLYGELCETVHRANNMHNAAK